MSRFVLLLSASLMILVAGCAGGPSSYQQPKIIPEGAVPILRQHVGEVGGPAFPGLYVIRTQRGFDNAGLVRPDRFQVDFASDMVLLFAVGNVSERGHWARIESVLAKDGEYVVRCRYNSPGGVPAQGRYRPFAMVVVPRSDITEARPVLLRSRGLQPPGGY
ncbi:MAG: hypothetical protein RLN76_04795 [Phycisphaeraceae bacterium]